jgi:hypothetical protein
LKSLFSARMRQDKPARDAAIRRACLEYDYTMAAVARDAGIHPLFDGEQGHKGGEMKTVMSRPLFRFRTVDPKKRDFQKNQSPSLACPILAGSAPTSFRL